GRPAPGADGPTLVAPGQRAAEHAAGRRVGRPDVFEPPRGPEPFHACFLQGTGQGTRRFPATTNVGGQAVRHRSRASPGGRPTTIQATTELRLRPAAPGTGDLRGRPQGGGSRGNQGFPRAKRRSSACAGRLPERATCAAARKEGLTGEPGVPPC